MKRKHCNDEDGRAKRKQCNDEDELVSEWLVAGERVTIAKLTQRKLRRLNSEQLRVFVYKQRLIDLGRAGDLLKTFAVFEEMQTQGLQVDLALIQMVLSACAGASWRDFDGGKGLSSGNSCEQHTQRAAEIAMEIYHKVSCWFFLAHSLFYIDELRTTQVCEKKDRVFF